MRAGQWGKRIPSRCAALFRYAVRGVRQPGQERDVLLLQVKAVIASLVAWETAHELLPAAVGTYAPLAALLVTRSTLYRSLHDCVQYLGAMAVGVLLAAAFGTTVGVHAWSLAVLISASLAAGKIQHLGAHGAQVAVMALFAFTAGQGEPVFIGHLALAILIGAACGLAAHVILAPSRHTQAAQGGVARLAAQAQHVLQSLADDLQDGPPTSARTRNWARHSAEFDRLADRMRATVEAERENAVLNPRRPSAGAEHVLPRLPATIGVLQRAFSHCHSIIRSLTYAARSDRWTALTPEFRAPYGDLLNSIADAMEEVGRMGPTDPDGLREMLREADRRIDALERQLTESSADAPAHLSLHGTLITDAGRLLSDLAQADPRDHEPAEDGVNR
ncbi:FUSC family protein [Streptomyces sp. SPB162]|uniref:FUSC family protein n=1 Tax=Streptomyces sp. SPB162 TaxID=2940560 RepID=UPI002404938C|nr:FUSC family protein [Streptomyces sp. SPB162]MDF9810823.1 hypothetical protein [Streptomyces sp. SPB162]